MRVIPVNNYQEMSDLAAELFIQEIKNDPEVVLGLATGGTPEATYRSLIQKSQDLDLSRIHTFNLDEYEGLSPSHPNSYHRYMAERLFEPLQLKASQTHLPRGDAADLENEAERYEQLIQEKGGVDVQLLGIGENGHIGFNEPGTSFTSRTHIVDLNPSTREANARYFEKKENVPNRAITMGIASIMDSRRIILLASGERKKQAMAKLLNEEKTQDFPASILQDHPYVTIIADEPALSAVSFEKGEPAAEYMADQREWELR
ncbi:glucosamine-6-phosphate deaminase [Salibacterium aidingense]|uniref:glucosamine-6-phosphate deaminase n=1 Tax=Salibacterium aidingense TaxID=384933 RepID=UPI0004016185|nr:glucosamine-6-phosphate deaminase [Salibacterium aidingense]